MDFSKIMTLYWEFSFQIKSEARKSDFHAIYYTVQEFLFQVKVRQKIQIFMQNYDPEPRILISIQKWGKKTDFQANESNLLV